MGFLGKAGTALATGGSYLSSFLPGGAAAGTTTGGFLGNIGGMFGGLFGGGPQTGDPTGGGGFFSGIMDGAKKLAGTLGGNLTEKIKDPNYMSEMLMRAGSAAAGSYIADRETLSPEEQKLLDAMTNDLKNLRSADEKLFDAQISAAKEVMQEGRAIDPEQVGLKAQRDVQIASGAITRQADKEAKMREGGRGLTAADRRRAGLETVAKGQSAYLEGLESGQDRRVKTIAAGAGLLPSSAPRGAIAAGLNLADTMAGHETRRGEKAKDTGKLIQDVFGFDKPRSTGDTKKPEKPENE
jgi:hypothetical protein